MSETDPEQRVASGDVHPLQIGGRTLILVGTAHISRESVDLVREVIEQERPDCVCVELDAQRFEALSQKHDWEKLDLRQVIRNRQLAPLLMNLLLASYQKRLGLQLGVSPGSELLEATRVADELGIPVELCDRDIRITLRRAWSALSLWRKLRLVSEIIASGFDRPELSEEQLRELRRKDVVTELMTELGEAMPALKEVLIDERDSYLARRIRDASGDKVVAVVGAGHVAGMSEALESGRDVDLEALSILPPVSPVWKWIGWAIPALIVSSIAYIGWAKGGQAAGENATFWFVANSVPTALGGVVAFAHPLTIVAAGLSAPFTSLTPLIGAGYVAAFVQTWLKPPLVREFQTAGEDLTSFRGWWSSRLLRIFLVFLLTTVGSVVGTWVGGIEIVSNLF